MFDLCTSRSLTNHVAGGSTFCCDLATVGLFVGPGYVTVAFHLLAIGTMLFKVQWCTLALKPFNTPQGCPCHPSPVTHPDSN